MEWRINNGRSRSIIDWLYWLPRGPSSSNHCIENCILGPTGPAGLAGPTGPVGLEGPVGSTGVTGVTGSVGPVGIIGVTGSVGPAGVTGVTGSVGIVGPVGLAGSAGQKHSSLNTLYDPINTLFIHAWKGRRLVCIIEGQQLLITILNRWIFI